MKKWKILLAAYIAVIFIHSAMPADLSSEESGRITELLLRLHLPVSEYLVRKSAHFLEYLAWACSFRKVWRAGALPGMSGSFLRLSPAWPCRLRMRPYSFFPPDVPAR